MQLTPGKTITTAEAWFFLKDASPDRIQEWNAWLATIPKAQRPSLEYAELQNCVLANVNLAGMSLERAVLTGSNLSHSNLAGCNLTGADFSQANLSRARLEGAYCTNPRMNHLAMLVGTRGLDSKKLTATRGSYSALFVLSNLQGAILNEAKLDFCLFSQARLEASKFDRASLTGAVLDGVRVNGDTSFKGASTDGMNIDRYSLLSLDSFGGLTVQQRMELHIEDSLATMRASFSGVWQWIHLIALLLFVGPYVWFVVARWSEASFDVPGPTVSLLKALSQYVVSGGESWGHGYVFRWTFALFAFGVVYNALRAALLWKTKQLELQQETTGLPPRFSLGRSVWGVAFKWCHYGFIVNVLLVGAHTFHFLLQEVPIPG